MTGLERHLEKGTLHVVTSPLKRSTITQKLTDKSQRLEQQLLDTRTATNRTGWVDMEYDGMGWYNTTGQRGLPTQNRFRLLRGQPKLSKPS